MAASTLTSDPVIAEALDDAFAAELSPKAPGGMVAVLVEDALVCCRSYGLAEVAWNIPWSADVRYPIASITKTMVAQMVLADGVDLDLDVRDLLHDHRDAVGPITLRHALNHTSGLPLDEDVLGLEEVAVAQDEERLRALAHRWPTRLFAPGAGQSYSCTNYRSISRAMVGLRGRSFDSLLEDAVLRPLGLHSTQVTPWLLSGGPRTALPYEPAPETPGGWSHKRATWHHSTGDGGVTSTLDDLVTWGRALRDPARLVGWSELAAAVPELAHGLQPFSGAGVLVRQVAGVEWIGHGGAQGTGCFWSPELDVTVITLCNNTTLHRWHDVQERAMRAVLAALGRPSAIVGADERLERAAGTWIDATTGRWLHLDRRDGGGYLDVGGDGARIEPSATPGAYVVQGGFAAYGALRVGDDHLELAAQTGPPVRWTRATRAHDRLVPGRFDADHLRGSIEIETDGSGWRLVVGAGQHDGARHPLEPLGCGVARTVTGLGLWFSPDGERVVVRTALGGPVAYRRRRDRPQA